MTLAATSPTGLVAPLFEAISRALGLTERRCGLCLTLGEFDRLCPDCLLRLRLGLGLEAPLPALGDPFAPPETPPGPWRRLDAFGPYRGALKEAVLAFKLGRRTGLSGMLGLVISAACLDRPRRIKLELAIPVPLHPTRLKRRGFNQSLELARLPAKRLGIPLDHGALVRVRDTVPQMLLSKKERSTNLDGAFLADPARVRGKRVLLVDDVVTTGSTLREAVKALLAAGALSVDALVAAATPPDALVAATTKPDALVAASMPVSTCQIGKSEPA